MGSSGKSITSSLLTNVLLSHATENPADAPSQGIYRATHLFLSSSLLSKSLALSPPMNLESRHTDLALNSTKNQKELHSTSPLLLNCAQPLLKQPAILNQEIFPSNPRNAKPTAYAPHLTPAPSPLCPHCLAYDHLCL
jgi:hypothetical protein